MLDVFANNPAYTLSGLTLAINRIPFIPQKIGELGLFRPERLATTTTLIEVRGTRLALVPELPRGSPATPDVEDRRGLIPLRVPHFPTRNSIYADEVQNVRAFGTEDQLLGVQAVVNQRQEQAAMRLDVTLEYLRLGAVKGIVITAVDRVTGEATLQYDLFDLFHVQRQPLLEWPIIGAGALAQDEAAWAGQLTLLVNSLGRLMADEISGGAYQRIIGVCGKTFFDAFAVHPERRAIFFNMNSIPENILGTDLRFRDVTITEYRGRVGNTPFVEDDMCYFFPVGAPDMFVEAFAPADYMETVNTVALPRYSKMESMDFDKGVQLESQMNVLPLCTTPRALFRARVIPFTPTTPAAETRSAGPASRPPARQAQHAA